MGHRIFRLAALGAMLFSPAGLAQAGVTKLCFEDTDNYPWHIKGGHGLSNVLLDMASARSGVSIEQQALPWKRCLHDIERGIVAGGFGASYNEERTAFAVYPTTADGKIDVSRRLKTDGYSVYRVKGSNVSWDGKHFVNLTGAVGAQLGYSVVADLKKLGVAVDEAPGGVDMVMRKLLLNRTEVAAALTFEGDDVIDDPVFAGKIEKILPPLTEKPYFVIFGKDYYSKNKKAVDDLWQSLAAARESKEFQLQKKEKLSGRK